MSAWSLGLFFTGSRHSSQEYLWSSRQKLRFSPQDGQPRCVCGWLLAHAGWEDSKSFGRFSVQCRYNLQRAGEELYRLLFPLFVYTCTRSMALAMLEVAAQIRYEVKTSNPVGVGVHGALGGSGVGHGGPGKDAGHHPGMRRFDLSERTRDAGTRRGEASLGVKWDWPLLSAAEGTGCAVSTVLCWPDLVSLAAPVHIWLARAHL